VSQCVANVSQCEQVVAGVLQCMPRVQCVAGCCGVLRCVVVCCGVLCACTKRAIPLLTFVLIRHDSRMRMRVCVCVRAIRLIQIHVPVCESTDCTKFVQ